MAERFIFARNATHIRNSRYGTTSDMAYYDVIDTGAKDARAEVVAHDVSVGWATTITVALNQYVARLEMMSIPTQKTDPITEYYQDRNNSRRSPLEGHR